MQEMLDKQNRVKISCVLTAINEGKTAQNVVKTLATYPLFYDVILVNDGSHDKTLSIFKDIAKKYKHIKVINHPTNFGKTQGILNAVKKTKGELIVMIDADLLTLKHSHIDTLIETILHKKYDMAILEKGSDAYGPIGWLQFIANRPYGGERALWKKDFMKIKINGNERYGLETIINSYYINNKKRILSIYTPDLLSLYKSQKTKNLFNSLLEWHGQIQDISKVSGANPIKQSVEIEDNRLYKLHDIKHKSKLKIPIILSIFMANIILSLTTFASLNIKRGIENIQKMKSRS